jgi:hypothetical protein
VKTYAVWLKGKPETRREYDIRSEYWAVVQFMEEMAGKGALGPEEDVVEVLVGDHETRTKTEYEVYVDWEPSFTPKRKGKA